jgi:hypothetical protein
MDLKVKWFEDMDWIYLTKDRNRWQTLDNMVINFLVSVNTGNFLTGKKRPLINAEFQVFTAVKCQCGSCFSVTTPYRQRDRQTCGDKSDLRNVDGPACIYTRRVKLTSTTGSLKKR